MEIKSAIAKHIGTNLITHNRNVSVSSEYIGKNYLKVTNSEVLRMIRLGGLLHDIGKMTEEFQSLLQKKIKKTTHKFRHNEIGGAFIYTYFNSKDLSINYISNSVYWHHGISNKLNDSYYSDVLEKVTDQEIEWMKELVIILLDESFILSDPRTGNIKTPLFYTDNDEENENMSIIRTCIISADRIVSMLEEQNSDLLINDSNVSLILDDILNEKGNKVNNVLIDKSPYNPEDRFNLQLDISTKCNQTTIIKAPAGFGKTMIGLIWSTQNHRKTLWVCPRNVVGESVYNSILNELDALGLPEKVTVELYMTGKTLIRNHDNNIDFTSDIIVTNIDNFLTPSFDDSLADRSFLTHSANIVFDEYHEFVSDAPYFACFINMMKARHHNTLSETLLLSATPIDISFFWDTIGRKTTILPDNKNHYPAAHNKKYLIRVTDELIYDKKGSDIVIFNSILESQMHKHRHPKSLLFHSEFTDETKHNLLYRIMNDFGKKSQRTIDKCSVTATLIARASLDVSFNYLYESCLSPDGTLQSAGRCDRFGDYNEESIITIFKPNSKSEKAVIELQYDEELSNKWYEDLLPYDGQRLTLNELYVIYNTHVSKYSKERKRYFEKRRRNSLKRLTTIYPIRYLTKRNIDIKTAGSNKLRSVGSELFFIVKSYNDPNKYIGPFTTQIYKSIQEDFQESGNVRGQMLGSMKMIMSEKDCDFDYNEILKNKKTITIDDLRIYGKKSNTPYIRYNEIYHPEYGLINIDKLTKLN